MGFAIALAWPKTWCKQAGAWYEPVTRWLGFNQNGYYQVGHAAIVLVNRNGVCKYFDFGRYHAPFGHGRVRSAYTDPELTIKTRAVIRAGKLLNINDILAELKEKEACHGVGDLYASYCEVNVAEALNKARLLQKISPLPYGPFVQSGTNCSRFVREVLLAGGPQRKIKLRLSVPYSISPTPLTNVQALKHLTIIPIKHKVKPPEAGNGQANRPSPSTIPSNAQWLDGEGAGSWFSIRRKGADFEISRFNPSGQLEFKDQYKLLTNQQFDPNQNFQMKHLSHYRKVKLSQGGKDYLFHIATDDDRRCDVELLLADALL